jgi:hypothetical protein
MAGSDVVENGGQDNGYRGLPPVSQFKLAGQDKLKITKDCPTLEKRMALVKDLMREIG